MEYDPAVFRRPGRGEFVRQTGRELYRLSAVDTRFIDIKIAVAVGVEGNPLAVVREMERLDALGIVRDLSRGRDRSDARRVDVDGPEVRAIADDVVRQLRPIGGQRQRPRA